MERTKQVLFAAVVVTALLISGTTADAQKRRGRKNRPAPQPQSSTPTQQSDSLFSVEHGAIGATPKATNNSQQKVQGNTGNAGSLIEEIPIPSGRSQSGEAKTSKTARRRTRNLGGADWDRTGQRNNLGGNDFERTGTRNARRKPNTSTNQPTTSQGGSDSERKPKRRAARQPRQ